MSTLIDTKRPSEKKNGAGPADGRRGRRPAPEEPPGENRFKVFVMIAAVVAVGIAVMVFVTKRLTGDDDALPAKETGAAVAATQPQTDQPAIVEAPVQAESPESQAEQAVQPGNAAQPTTEVDEAAVLRKQTEIAQQQANIWADRLEREQRKPPEERKRNLPSEETMRLLRAGKITIE